MSLVTEQINIRYKLTFESAFHFGTGLRNGLTHRTVARNSTGYLYVPGSTLKGVLRERCEQIARSFGLKANEPHSEASNRTEANTRSPDIIVRTFGSRFLPSQLYFDDAQMISEDKDFFDSPNWPGKYKMRQVEQRTQVSLSRSTRTAKAGHLYSSEYGARQLRFDGQIYGYIRNFSLEPGQPGTYSLLLLLASLISLNEIGGNKSSGAGRVSCEISEYILIDGVKVTYTRILEQLPTLEYYQLEQEDGNDL